MISELFPTASADQEKPPMASMPAEALIQSGSSGVDAAGGISCRIMDHPQGSKEWKDARRRIFTASEVGLFLVEEPKMRLTKADMLVELESLGIEANPKATNVELEKLFPDITPYLSFTEKFHESRRTMIRKKAALQTAEGIARDEEQSKKLDYNFDVKRGNQLEPITRKLYADKQKCVVAEVGLCVHQSSAFDMFGMPLDGFGCSPDGLIAGDDDRWMRGLEIKAPSPERLLQWLDEGVLPEEHAAQVQVSMAVTGLREWDFAAYCPGLPLFLVRTKWSATTDRMLAELKKLHADYVEYRGKIDPKRISRVGFETPSGKGRE